MKVPLENEPFAPVELTRSQGQQLEWLSDALLQETLAEYTQFVELQQRRLDPTQWKHTMSRESIAIYKRVGHSDLGGVTPDVVLDKPTPTPTHDPTRTMRWRVPRVLGVGTLVGSLDDLLYGYLATTTTDTIVRKQYLQDEAADGRVVANVIYPTTAQPLRSLLVRWSLFCNFLHHLGVTQRDVVNMESMGIHTLANGDRVGYVLSQSIDLPGCGALSELGVIRTTFSSCYLFRDTGNGSVELFMRGFIEPGGRLADSVAVIFAAGTMILAWRLLISSHNKKLAWLLQKAAASQRTESYASDYSSTSADTDIHGTSDAKICGLCHKSKSVLRSRSRCDVCYKRFCSRCVDKHKLMYVNALGDLTHVTARVCKPCVVQAAATNAIEVARSENVALENQADNQPEVSFESSTKSGTISSSTAQGIVLIQDDVATWSIDERTGKVGECNNSDSSNSSSTETSSLGMESQRRDGGSISNETHSSSPEYEMYMRMNALREAAEETYQLTKHQSQIML